MRKGLVCLGVKQTMPLAGFNWQIGGKKPLAGTMVYATYRGFRLRYALHVQPK